MMSFSKCVTCFNTVTHVVIISTATWLFIKNLIVLKFCESSNCHPYNTVAISVLKLNLVKKKKSYLILSPSPTINVLLLKRLKLLQYYFKAIFSSLYKLSTQQQQQQQQQLWTLLVDSIASFRSRRRPSRFRTSRRPAVPVQTRVMRRCLLPWTLW